MSSFRILLTDDHGIMRGGIRSLLNSQPDLIVVGEASNGQEAITKTAELNPDLVLMDITMSGMNGIEATRIIKSTQPNVVVLILTMHDDEEFFFPAIRAGANGYILKDSEPEDLLNAIRSVCQGNVYFSPAITVTIAHLLMTPRTQEEEKLYNLLTRREKEVLGYAARGMSNRIIAEALFLSKRTVEKHRQAIMDKLGLATREELTKYALRKGLIDQGN